jgi:hypothetical protein
LIRSLGDLPEGRDARLNNMKRVILKLQNIREQLCLFGDSPPVQGHPLISDLFDRAYEDDLLPGKILEAIPTNGSLKECTVAEYMKQGGQIWYQGMECVPKFDLVWLRLLQDHDNTALAGHLERAKTFDFLDRRNYWKNIQKQVD